MPVAMILVDALSASYAPELPSLRKIAEDGLAAPLENIYAYRGIEATLFTGCTPAQHGIWGEFRPANLPQMGGIGGWTARSLMSIGDILPSDRLRLDVRYVAARLQRMGHMPTGNLIPAAMMPRFRGSIETDIWNCDALPVPTLFDEIRDAGGSFETVVYPTIRLDHEVSAWVQARVRRGNLPDFWYIKFSALDALGHKYGPSGQSMLPALRLLDAQIAELESVLRGAYGEQLDLVVLADHGMSSVDRRVDVRPILASTGLTPVRDYLYFLDSTTVRVWSGSQENLEKLRGAFERIPGMSLLDAVARTSLAIPQDESAGDLLVALDEGSVVFPDFFRRSSAPLGMHGYARVVSEAGLPYLAAGPGIAEGLALPTSGHLGHADIWAAMRAALGVGDVCPSPLVPEQHASLEVA